MQNLRTTTTAANEGQNPGMSALHVLKARYNKMRPAVGGIQTIWSNLRANPLTAVEQHHHTQRRTAQARMLNATSVGRRDISREAASPRKGIGHGKIEACKSP